MSQTANQLQLALNSLSHFITIVYSLYSEYIKLFVLGVIAFLGYQLGKLSYTQDIEKKVKNIRNEVENRSKWKIESTKKIERAKKWKNWMLILSTLMTIICIGLHVFEDNPELKAILQQIESLKPLKLKELKTPIPLTAILLLISIILTAFCWLWQKILIRKQLKIPSSIIFDSQLNELLAKMGSRVCSLLRNTLCRQTIIKQSKERNALINQCVKQNCKEIRSLYKARQQSIMRLVDDVLNFEWCTICKKRPQFNEFLKFESRVYQPIPPALGEDSTAAKLQDLQAINRNKYLLEELDRMLQWIHQINPCNCSKRYWQMSLKEIREWGKQEKENEERIKVLEQIIEQKRAQSERKIEEGKKTQTSRLVYNKSEGPSRLKVE